MEKALNEIGKLRNEMKIGFIEVENQLKSTREELVDSIQKVSSGLDQVVSSLEKFSTNVERGFLAIEDAMDEDVKSINNEISAIKKRLDDANL